MTGESLEEAAKKVGISKKSLDDYFLQLKNGKVNGFNFNEHKQDKIGILRNWNKHHKDVAKIKERSDFTGSIGDFKHTTFKKRGQNFKNKK